MVEHDLLKQHINEELQDVHHYMDAYHQTNQGVFKDLAKEEYSHARILKNIMENDGESGKEFIDQFKEAKAALNF